MRTIEGSSKTRCGRLLANLARAVSVVLYFEAECGSFFAGRAAATKLFALASGSPSDVQLGEEAPHEKPHPVEPASGPHEDPVCDLEKPASSSGQGGGAGSVVPQGLELNLASLGDFEGLDKNPGMRRSSSAGPSQSSAASEGGTPSAGQLLEDAALAPEEDETQGTTSNVVGSAFPGVGELDFDRLVALATTPQLEEQQRGVVQATTIPATAGAATSSRTKARSRQTTSGTPAAAGVPDALDLGPPQKSSTLNQRTLDTLQRELQPDVFARPHRTSSPNTSVHGGAIKTPDQEQKEQQLIQATRLARFRKEWEDNMSPDKRDSHLQLMSNAAAAQDHMVKQAAVAQQRVVQDHEQQLVTSKILDNVAALHEQFPFDPVTAPEVLAARAAENPASFGKSVGVLLSSHDGGKRSREGYMPREDHANETYNQNFPVQGGRVPVGRGSPVRPGSSGARQSSAAGFQRGELGSSAIGGVTDSDDIAEMSPFRTTRPFKELMLYREFVHRSSKAVLGNSFTNPGRMIISDRDYDTIAIVRQKTALGQAEKCFRNETEEVQDDEAENPQTRKSSSHTAESFSSPPRGGLSPEQELGGERAGAQGSASASASSATAAAQAAVDPAAANAAAEERREKRKRSCLLDRDNGTAVEYLISVEKLSVGRGPSAPTSQGGTNVDSPPVAGNYKEKPRKLFTGASRPPGSVPSEDHEADAVPQLDGGIATTDAATSSEEDVETWVKFAIHIPDIGFFEPGLLPLFRGDQDTDGKLSTTTRPADDDVGGSTGEHQQQNQQQQQPVNNPHRSLSALVTDSYDKRVQAEFRRSIPLYHLRRLFAIMTLDNVKKTYLPSSGSSGRTSSSTRRGAAAPTSRRSSSKGRPSSRSRQLVEKPKQQKQEEKDDNDLDKNSPPKESYILTNTLFFEVRTAPPDDKQAGGTSGGAGPSAAGGAGPWGVRASNIRSVRLVRNTAVRNGAQIAIDRDLVFPSRTSARETRTTGHVSTSRALSLLGAAATVRHNYISPGSGAGAIVENVSPGPSVAGGTSSSAGGSSSVAPQATTPAHDQHIRSNEHIQPAAPFTDQGSLAKLLFTALQHLPIASFGLYKQHLADQIQEMQLLQNLAKKYPQTWRMLNPVAAGGTRQEHQPQEQEMTSPPGADGSSRPSPPSVGDHTLDTRTLDQETTPPTRQISTLDESSTVVGTEAARTPASLVTPGTGSGGAMTPNAPNSRSLKNVFEDFQRGLQAAQYLALQKVGLVTPFTKAFDASVQIAAHFSTYARLPGRKNEQDQSPGQFLLEQTDQRNIVVVDLNFERQTVLVYLPREKYHVDTKDEEAAGARQPCGGAGSSSSAPSTSGGLGSPPVPMNRRAQQQAGGAPGPVASPPLRREFTRSRTTPGDSYGSSARSPLNHGAQPPGSPKRTVEKSPEELLESGDPRFRTPQRPKKGEPLEVLKLSKPNSWDKQGRKNSKAGTSSGPFDEQDPAESSFAWRQNIFPGARSEGSAALPPYSPDVDELDELSVAAGSSRARTARKNSRKNRRDEPSMPIFGPWGDLVIAMRRNHELCQKREKQEQAQAAEAAAALLQVPAGAPPAADSLALDEQQLPAELQSVTTRAAAARVVLGNPIIPVISDTDVATTGGASSEQPHGDDHVPAPRDGAPQVEPLLHPEALFTTPLLFGTTTPPPVVPAGLPRTLAGALARPLNNNDEEQAGGRAATPTFGGGTEIAGTTTSGLFSRRAAGPDERLVQFLAGPSADEPLPVAPLFPPPAELLPVAPPLSPPSTPRAARAPTPSFGQVDEHPEASSLPAPGEQTPLRRIRPAFFHSPEKGEGDAVLGQQFIEREDWTEAADLEERLQRAHNLFAQVRGRGAAPAMMPPPFSLPPIGISMPQQGSSSAAAAAAAARAPGDSTGSADEVGVVGTTSSEAQRGHLMPTSARCSAAAEEVLDQQEQPPGATPGGPHVEQAPGYQPGGNGDPNIATCAAEEEVVVERPSPGAEAPQAMPAGSSPKDFRLVRDQLQLQQRGQHHQQPTQFAFPTREELQPAEPPGLVVPQLPPRPDYAQQQEQPRNLFNIPSSAASAAGLSSSASDAGVVAVSGLRETATLVDGIAHYGKHNELQGTTPTHDPHSHQLRDPFATPDRPALRRGRSADSSALSGAAGASAVLGHRSASSIYSKQELDKGYIAGDFCEHPHANEGEQQAAGNKPIGTSPTSSSSILKQRADKPHGFALEISIKELRRAQLSAFGQAVPAEDGTSAGSTIQPDRPEGNLRFALRDGIGAMRHRVASFSTIKAVAPPATAGTASAASGPQLPSYSSPSPSAPSPWVLYKRTVSRQAEAFLIHEVSGLSPSAASEVLKRELQRQREIRRSSSSSSQIEVGATADASHPLDLVLPIKEKLKLYEGYPAQIFHSYNLMSLGAVITKQQMHDQLLHVLQKILGTPGAPAPPVLGPAEGGGPRRSEVATVGGAAGGGPTVEDINNYRPSQLHGAPLLSPPLQQDQDLRQREDDELSVPETVEHFGNPDDRQQAMELDCQALVARMQEVVQESRRRDDSGVLNAQQQQGGFRSATGSAGNSVVGHADDFGTILSPVGLEQVRRAAPPPDVNPEHVRACLAGLEAGGAGGGPAPPPMARGPQVVLQPARPAGDELQAADDGTTSEHGSVSNLSNFQLPSPAVLPSGTPPSPPREDDPPPSYRAGERHRPSAALSEAADRAEREGLRYRSIEEVVRSRAAQEQEGNERDEQQQLLLGRVDGVVEQQQEGPRGSGVQPVVDAPPLQNAEWVESLQPHLEEQRLQRPAVPREVVSPPRTPRRGPSPSERRANQLQVSPQQLRTDAFGILGGSGSGSPSRPVSRTPDVVRRMRDEAAPHEHQLQPAALQQHGIGSPLPPLQIDVALQAEQENERLLGQHLAGSRSASRGLQAPLHHEIPQDADSTGSPAASVSPEDEMNLGIGEQQDEQQLAAGGKNMKDETTQIFHSYNLMSLGAVITKQQLHDQLQVDALQVITKQLHALQKIIGARKSPADGGEEDVFSATGGCDAEQQHQSDVDDLDSNGITKSVTMDTQREELRRQLEDLDSHLIDPTDFFADLSVDDVIKLIRGEGAFKRSGPTKIWSIQDLIFRDALQRDGSAADAGSAVMAAVRGTGEHSTVPVEDASQSLEGLHQGGASSSGPRGGFSRGSGSGGSAGAGGTFTILPGFASSGLQVGTFAAQDAGDNSTPAGQGGAVGANHSSMGGQGAAAVIIPHSAPSGGQAGPPTQPDQAGSSGTAAGAATEVDQQETGAAFSTTPGTQALPGAGTGTGSAEAGAAGTSNSGGGATSGPTGGGGQHTCTAGGTTGGEASSCIGGTTSPTVPVEAPATGGEQTQTKTQRTTGGQQTTPDDPTLQHGQRTQQEERTKQQEQGTQQGQETQQDKGALKRSGPTKIWHI
ncbi:unnamed protein product [Amoebophrya sp. A120]|nr:unnamed protein product [Amoebophrya sp. A120]|eukprot:GSA120T00014643001.1